MNAAGGAGHQSQLTYIVPCMLRFQKPYVRETGLSFVNPNKSNV